MGQVALHQPAPCFMHQPAPAIPLELVVILDKDIQRIHSFLLNMAFVSSSEVENIYISCENVKHALFYIHMFLYFTTVYPR